LFPLKPARQPTSFNFRERRRPLITLQLEEGDFTIDPNFDVEDMGEAAVVEEMTNEVLDTLRATSYDDPGSLERAREIIPDRLAKGNEFILHLIRRRHPDAPAVKLYGEEILQVLAAIGDGESIETVILDAIRQLRSDGIIGPDGTLVESPGPGASGGGADEGPLRSTSSSRGRSSGSAKSGAGRRTTSSGSRGGSSKRTSRTRAKP
jgi:hypothetical protein